MLWLPGFGVWGYSSFKDVASGVRLWGLGYSSFKDVSFRGLGFKQVLYQGFQVYGALAYRVPQPSFK